VKHPRAENREGAELFERSAMSWLNQGWRRQAPGRKLRSLGSRVQVMGEQNLGEHSCEHIAIEQKSRQENISKIFPRGLLLRETLEKSRQ
jgi:hypothetical protein